MLRHKPSLAGSKGRAAERPRDADGACQDSALAKTAQMALATPLIWLILVWGGHYRPPAHTAGVGKH